MRKWLLVTLLLVAASEVFAWNTSKTLIETVEKNPITIDTSKLPHFAALSPKMMNYYFKPEIDWNLQYLIWKTWVSYYLSLSEEHQEFIQKLADLLLTDDYAKNIEENKRTKTRNYEVVSSWKKDLKTSSLWLFLKRTIFLLQDIQSVRTWVDSSYKDLFKTLNKYEKKRWYNTDPKIYELLETLKPEIDWVLSVHKFLDEKFSAQNIDFKKREEAISTEIERIKAEIREKDAILEKEKQKWEEKDKEINELNRYLKTLNKFLDVTWRSE